MAAAEAVRDMSWAAIDRAALKLIALYGTDAGEIASVRALMRCLDRRDASGMLWNRIAARADALAAGLP